MKLFLHKAMCEEEFIAAAKKEGCDRVTVQPFKKARHFAHAATTGITGYFEYFLKISAIAAQGRRKVKLKKVTFERIADETWSEEEREKSRIRVFLLGEKEAEKLQKELPDVRVTLMHLDGESIDLKQLHRDAAERGVSI